MTVKIYVTCVKWFQKQSIKYLITSLSTVTRWVYQTTGLGFLLILQVAMHPDAPYFIILLSNARQRDSAATQ